MKFSIRLLIAALIINAPYAVSAATPPIRATLILPNPTVLPGVPFDLAVEFKNESSRPLSVGLIAHMHVTLSDGHTYVTSHYSPLTPDSDIRESTLELAPGEAVQRYISWFVQSWGSDGKFTGPGIYDIQLELERGADTPPENYVGRILTTHARLERVVSPGIDEKIWQNMLAARKGDWSDNAFERTGEGAELVKNIVETASDSGYYPYAVFFNRLNVPRADSIAPLLDAAERYRTSPAAPYLVTAAAVMSEVVSENATLSGESAKQYKRQAAELYRRAARISTLPAARDDLEQRARNIESLLQPTEKQQ